MKHVLLLLLVIASISCKNRASEPKENFDWILGNWIRTNDPEGYITFENWNKKNTSEYIGLSYTMQHKDTVWQENIRFVRNNETWSFEVIGKGEAEPTTFRLTKTEHAKFVCENQENEFPKKIEYAKNGDLLRAKISGGDREVAFDFTKTDD